MRVVAIENSRSDIPEAILVQKESVYNVVEQRNTGVARVGTQNDTWYVLLETGKYIHHSSIFRELTKEELLEEEKEIQEIYDKIKQG